MMFTVKVISRSIQYLFSSSFKDSSARMKNAKNCSILLNLFKSLYSQDHILTCNGWKIVTTDITLGLFVHESSSLKS